MRLSAKSAGASIETETETETIPLIEQCQFPTDRPTDELHLKIFRKMLGPSTWRNFLRLASFWPRSELLERYRPTPVLFSCLSRPDSAASRNRTAAHNVPHIYKTQLQLLLSVVRPSSSSIHSVSHPASQNNTGLQNKIKIINLDSWPKVDTGHCI